MLSIGTKIIFA